MKKSELIQIIKEVVRLELRKTVRQVVKEEIALFIDEHEKIESVPSLSELREEIKPKPPSRKKRRYANNEALNKILNQTDSLRFHEANAGLATGVSQEIVPERIITPSGRVVGKEQVHESVANALNRNYADLLKKVEEKANKSRGG